MKRGQMQSRWEIKKLRNKVITPEMLLAADAGRASSSPSRLAASPYLSSSSRSPPGGFR